MARTLSSRMLQAMFSESTDEVIIVLIEIDHEDLLEPLLVTSDAVDTVSNGDTYVGYPFEIVLPDEPEEGRSPAAQIRISNVDREIVDTLRAISGPPRFTMKLVLASDADHIEASWPNFILRSATYDASFVSGELLLDDYSTEPWPADSYVPSTFPALF